MAAESKYSAAPEVVPLRYGEDAPEVVPGGDLEHGQNYTNLPEAVQHHTADPKYDSQTIPPAYSESRGFIPADQTHTPQRKRRRWKLWAIIGVVLLLVIVGAVVGGVVGSRKSSTSSSDSSSSSTSSSSGGSASSTARAPFSANTNTALALTNSDSNTKQYAYQQLANGSIVEIPYTQSGGWDYGNAGIAVSRAPSGTSLAATTFSIGGQTFRMLMYPGNNGVLNVVNTTNQGTWTTPIDALAGQDTVVSGSALAICSDPTRRIRIYYGSSNGYYQEIGYDFTGSKSAFVTANVFQLHQPFNGSDLNAGIACTMNNDIVHVYMKYKTQSSNTISQFYYDFTTSGSSGWKLGPLPVSPYSTVGPTTNIAATTDGSSSNTDYVFWTLQNGTTVEAVYNSYQSISSSYATLSNVPAKSELAAIYQSSGQNTLLQYKNSGSANVSYIILNSSGSVQSSGNVD